MLVRDGGLYRVGAQSGKNVLSCTIEKTTCVCFSQPSLGDAVQQASHSLRHETAKMVHILAKCLSYVHTVSGSPWTESNNFLNVGSVFMGGCPTRSWDNVVCVMEYHRGFDIG